MHVVILESLATDLENGFHGCDVQSGNAYTAGLRKIRAIRGHKSVDRFAVAQLATNQYKISVHPRILLP